MRAHSSGSNNIAGARRKRELIYYDNIETISVDVCVSHARLIHFFDPHVEANVSLSVYEMLAR